MSSVVTERISVSVTRARARPVRTCAAASAAWFLSVIVSGLLVVESLLGLLVSGLYPEETWAIAALRGNDLITLALVAPVLVVALARVRREPTTLWTLAWTSALLYNVYNFAYYVFGTRFNDVFLLHVASLALSLIALILLASSLDVEVIAARAAWGGRTRTVAILMLAIGVALVAAWGGMSVRFAVTGELPADIMPPEAVHLVYAIDLSLLAPSFLLGGILLLRRVAWGFVLGVVVNAFGAAYLLVLEFVGGFQANAGIERATWLSVPAIAGALLTASAAALLLRPTPSILD